MLISYALHAPLLCVNYGGLQENVQPPSHSTSTRPLHPPFQPLSILTVKRCTGVRSVERATLSFLDSWTRASLEGKITHLSITISTFSQFSVSCNHPSSLSCGEDDSEPLGRGQSNLHLFSLSLRQEKRNMRPLHLNEITDAIKIWRASEN